MMMTDVNQMKRDGISMSPVLMKSLAVQLPRQLRTELRLLFVFYRICGQSFSIKTSLHNQTVLRSSGKLMTCDGGKYILIF